MSRYRKTMAQAMNEGAIAMQVAALKKAYEPMRNKRISLDNANKLSQIFNRFDANKEMLKQLYKADIPFVSAMASSRLISKHNMKAQELMQIRKEGIETATEELQQINEIFLGEGVGHISGFRNDKEKANVISLAKQHGLKVDDSGSKLKISGNMRKILDIQLAVQKNGLKAEEVRVSLEEGKMKTIATMFNQGKSAEEIAKKMGLDVKTVKSILGEQEKIYEFKKMTVTIADPMKRNKAMQDIEKQGFKIQRLGSRGFKVDGNGADLNKYATDLKNFYGADVRAESYTIDESADEDFYNPVTEACWTGYKQVGMKDKGGKKVPNCVPESVEEDKKKSKKDIAPDGDAEHAEKKDIKEEDDAKKLENELKQKENEIAQLKQKAETDKAKNVAKATDKMVNPETGEPLLQVGIAYKHLRQKMAKDAAARDDAKQKEEEEKKKAVARFKSRINKESVNLDESDASDQAKSMGLDYMKFGRYGKDGKVTHISKGGQLVKTTGDKDVDDVNKSLAKARGDKKKDEPKQEPAPKPKIDKFDAQKDLEKEVTDGMIDVEDDGEGGLSMSKEYEPSQDYEAERDSIAIKDYLMDKGVDEDDIYIDVESEDDYIQVNVQVRGQKVDEELNKDDEKVIKQVKDMLKGASAKHAAQAKMIDKALKSEADLSKSQIKRVHDKADELPKKDFKDRYGKDGDSVRYAVATNIIKKKDGMKVENSKHPAKEVYESIAAVRKKADKSGMPYSILKKVYDRGMAAWRGGHRPGATQVQWALARVNSFVTKSSGTWGGADKDLAKQVRGSK